MMTRAIPQSLSLTFLLLLLFLSFLFEGNCTASAASSEPERPLKPFRLLPREISLKSAEFVIGYGEFQRVLCGNYTMWTKERPVVKGDVVQVDPKRACAQNEATTKGNKDLTLTNAIVVINYSNVPPFMAGCISVHNQVRFASDSGASAVILLGTEKLPGKDIRHPSVTSPVLTLNELNGQLFKEIALYSGRIGIRMHGLIYSFTRLPGDSLTADSFSRDYLIIILVGIAIVMTSIGFCVCKCRRHCWRLRGSGDSPKLATQGRSSSIQRILNFLTLTCPEKDLKESSLLERTRNPELCRSDEVQCCICFEPYQANEITRALTCKHEFHKECVDMWFTRDRDPSDVESGYHARRLNCPICKKDLTASVQNLSSALLISPTQSLAYTEQEQAVEAQSVTTDHFVSPLPPCLLHSPGGAYGGGTSAFSCFVSSEDPPPPIPVSSTFCNLETGILSVSPQTAGECLENGSIFDASHPLVDPSSYVLFPQRINEARQHRGRRKKKRKLAVDSSGLAQGVILPSATRRLLVNPLLDPLDHGYSSDLSSNCSSFAPLPSSLTLTGAITPNASTKAKPFLNINNCRRQRRSKLSNLAVSPLSNLALPIDGAPKAPGWGIGEQDLTQLS